MIIFASIIFKKLMSSLSCLILPTTFPFDAGSSVTSEKCIIFEDPASKENVVGMIKQMTTAFNRIQCFATVMVH